MRAQPKASARLIYLNSDLAFVCVNGVFLDDVEFLRLSALDDAYDVSIVVRGVCMRSVRMAELSATCFPSRTMDFAHMLATSVR